MSLEQASHQGKKEDSLWKLQYLDIFEEYIKAVKRVDMGKYVKKDYYCDTMSMKNGLDGKKYKANPRMPWERVNSELRKERPLDGFDRLPLYP